MKKVFLFASICFCLWFLSEVTGATVWVMQLIEQNPNFALETVLIYYSQVARLVIGSNILYNIT